MTYRANLKQALAHKAFMVDGFKRGVLLWGRQCLVGDTLVSTDRGFIPIADIIVGDKVLSYGKDWEYKKVTNTWEYGVDVEPVPMLEYVVHGETIKSTYNHPFYFNGQLTPIYRLAWGSMAASQRQKLKLLCQQYGAAFDDPTPQRSQNSGDEASSRRKRLSEDSSGQEDNQSSSSSGSDLDTKPPGQTRSQSQERDKNRQSDRESGVGNSSGKHPTLPRQRMGSQQTGRKLRFAQTQRATSARDTETQGDNDPQTTSGEVWGFQVHNPGHLRPNELVSYITVSECEPTFAIEVEDNHNYCITESEILVGNSGKTFFATNHGWISAVTKQGRYFIVFSTYKQAHEVVWRQYLSLIPKELVFRTNESDLLIEFNYLKGDFRGPDGTLMQLEHDETKPRSTLQLLGSDQADSHRGFKADGIVFDEYADQNPDNWDAVYKHFFTTTNGWAIFMGTPRGYNHFYDLIEDAKTHGMDWWKEEEEKQGFPPKEYPWFYQEATWRDSPYVKPEMIEAEKKEAERKGTLSTFMQEVELEFRSVQGAVFPTFDRKIHIVRPTEIPQELTIYSGIDFGYHTTACVLVGIDKDQTWWVFDEIYGRQETLVDIIPRIKDRIGDKRLVLMIGDSQAKDAIETMAQKGFPIVPVTKSGASTVPGGSISHGIDLIRTMLKPRIQLVGEPKPTIFFSSTCKNLIQEIEAYSYPEDKKDRNPSEVPMKDNDHGPDALRYIALHLKYGLQPQEKPLKFELTKQMNEYNLI